LKIKTENLKQSLPPLKQRKKNLLDSNHLFNVSPPKFKIKRKKTLKDSYFLSSSLSEAKSSKLSGINFSASFLLPASTVLKHLSISRNCSASNLAFFVCLELA